MEWSVKTLLNPIIVRAHIYGVNAIDLEGIINKIDEVPLVNKNVLSNTWLKLWQDKIDHYKQMADEAKIEGNLLSAAQFMWCAVQGHYARYLINCDEIEKKKAIYDAFKLCYEAYIVLKYEGVRAVHIPLTNDKHLPGYLFLPKGEGPFGCVILLGGIGSCKEELHTQMVPLLERNIAVLTCDMPGTGAALFDEKLTSSGKNVEEAIHAMVAFIRESEVLDENRIGISGICMGGGYAYHGAAIEPMIKCCVNLFPLFVTTVDRKNIPKWMRVGEWANYQSGTTNEEMYMQQMKCLEEGEPHCAYLLVHSKYDNWVPVEQAEALYERVQGNKEKIIMEEEPTFSTGQATLHAMPVGEQMHWLKYKISDWIVKQFNL